MIISFAWTSEALLLGKKTVTRRTWTDNYAKRFKKGDSVKAYDKNPRFKGIQIATIVFTKAPYKQKLKDMPESHLEKEGGLWKDKAEFIKLFGGDENLEVWVIEFKMTHAISKYKDLTLFEEIEKNIWVEL